MRRGVAADRITRLTVHGVRTLANVDLSLDGLTVLIGENGSGKSTLVELCEVLRLAASPSFMDQLYQYHGGPGALLRLGSSRMRIGVRIEGGGDPIDYAFELEQVAPNRIAVSDESLELPASPSQGSSRLIIVRNKASGRVFDSSRGYVDVAVDDQHLISTAFGSMPPHPALRRTVDALESIAVHLAFDTTPQWAANRLGRQTALRASATVQPRKTLSLLGVDLPLAYQALKNDFGTTAWAATLQAVRMGLGDDVEDVITQAGASGGALGLAVRYHSWTSPIPAFALSDGTLAYLAFVALTHLPHERALLAFDEPGTHLHPELLMRVLGMFEGLSLTQPVLLATHSDRLLDGLATPAESVVLCELGRGRVTKLRRPDPAGLARWMERYRGLGDIRGAGHLGSVIRGDD